MNGVGKVFEIERPNYRIAAIQGPLGTPQNRIRDGYIINAEGEFLELDERVHRLINKEYDYKLRKNNRDQAAYESAKREVVRYMNINVSPWIKEKVKALGNAYTDSGPPHTIVCSY